LGRPVLGSNETVSALGRDQVVEYWRNRYNASNLVVAAAGHVDHSQLVDCVAQLFGRGGSRTVRDGQKPQPRFGVDVHTRPTEQAHVIWGKEGLPRNHDDRHALTVRDTVLGGGMSSRLFQEVREKRGLAYSVYSYRSFFADGGTFGVYAGTTPQNVETVLDIIQEEIASVIADGITEAELERAKGHVKGSLVLSWEDPGSRMNRVGKQQLTTGEILSIDELIERFERLQMEDIVRVADEVLGSGPSRVTVLGPFDQDAFDRYAA
jgi:predicted Zn-dependent peptidase